MIVFLGGIYDLELMYKRGDVRDYFFGESYLEEVIGTDKTRLADFSPVSRAGLLQAPVLIAHGKKDRRAPYTHAGAIHA